MADDEMTIEEEEKHAQIGAWVGLLLFPFLLLCICGIFAITPRGRMALDELVLLYARDGIPYVGAVEVTYFRGFPGTAKASCDLDHQNPKPSNFTSTQDQLSKEYEALVEIYKDSWRNFKKHGGDPNEYEPPSDVPSDFFGGKLRYCR